MMTKDSLQKELITPRTVLRRTVQDDIAHFDTWRGYEWPYNWYNINAKARSRCEGQWWTVLDKPSACHYTVVLPGTGQIIGLHAFLGIDYEKRLVANMAIRIHPDLCDQGYGRETLQPLLEAVLQSGMRSIRLDVAATNTRAIRCYERCGMRIVDEYWMDCEAPDEPKWEPLMPHMRLEGDEWFLRLYWLEIRAQDTPSAGGS